jgi:hypothetical protein
VGHPRRGRLWEDEAKQPRDHVQVLASRHGQFDRGVLPSQPDDLPYLLRMTINVNAGHPQGPGVGTDQ